MSDRPRRQAIEAYLSRLFGYAVWLTGDREQARDLVQDCAVKALAAKTIPEEAPAYRAWLLRILRNTFIDRLRRPGRRLEELHDDWPAEKDGVWRCEDDLITGLTVKLGLAKLSPAHREIIGLIDIVGLSYAEASKLLDIPRGTVMSRLSRAREALLRIIAGSNVRPLPVETLRQVQ